MTAILYGPTWTAHLLWTLLTCAGAYLVGQIVQAALLTRLARLAARTTGDADDVLIAEIRRRVPLWSLLLGLYLSLAYWGLRVEWHVTAARLISAIAVASITLTLATVATRLVVTFGPMASVPVSGLTTNLVRGFVVVLGALVIINSFGYSITPMLTALGVGGLAVALALQDPLSNLFAGLTVSLTGQIRMGDFIRLDNGVEGSVLDFNWRSTRLRQLAGNVVEVPNAKLAQAVITNYARPTPDVGLGVEFTVDYDNDLAHVERLATAVAEDVIRSVAGADPTALPSVRYLSFSDWGVKFSVGVRVLGYTDQFLVRSELVKRLHARLLADGVRLPDPSGAGPRRPRDPA